MNLLIVDLNVLFPDKSHLYDAAIPEVGVQDPIENHQDFLLIHENLS
jgi:hypothetical protein